MLYLDYIRRRGLKLDSRRDGQTALTMPRRVRRASRRTRPALGEHWARPFLPVPTDGSWVPRGWWSPITTTFTCYSMLTCCFLLELEGFYCGCSVIVAKTTFVRPFWGQLLGGKTTITLFPFPIFLPFTNVTSYRLFIGTFDTFS